MYIYVCEVIFVKQSIGLRLQYASSATLVNQIYNWLKFLSTFVIKIESDEANKLLYFPFDLFSFNRNISRYTSWHLTVKPFDKTLR